MSRKGVAREGSPAAVHPGMVVALDVGGTAMKGAVLDADDRVVSFYRWPTPRSDGPAVVVEAVLSAVDELLSHAEDAVAVGLVVPGLVDDHGGGGPFFRDKRGAERTVRGP